MLWRTRRPLRWRHHAACAGLALAPLTWTLRGAGGNAPFVSDNGNLVIDLLLPDGIAGPAAFGAQLKSVTGVVEHGIFAGLARACLVAGPDGVRVMGDL